MYDTGAISTFEKYVLGTRSLDDRQLENTRQVRAFLRNVGIEKTIEEIVLLLGYLTPEEMAAATAEIKAKWQIAIPRPRVFTISAAQDEALQKSLVDKGPEMAKNVVECRKIADGLVKFGLKMTVSEVIIAKGYYVPASMRNDGPVLEPAPTTEEMKLRKMQEDAAAANPRKGGSGIRPGVKPGSGVRPAPRPGSDSGYRHASVGDVKRKQRNMLLITGAAVAVVVIAAGAYILSQPKPTSDVAKKPDVEPVKIAAADPKKDVAPEKTPEKIVPTATPSETPTATATSEPKKTAMQDPSQPNPFAAAAAKPPAPAPEPTKEPTPEPAPEPEPKDVPAPEPAKQDPPEPAPPPTPEDIKERKKKERAAKAEKLWEGAQQLFKDGKYSDAQDAGRELRERFLETKTYLDNHEAIENLIVDCGYKIATAGLAGLKLYGKDKPHIDTILGFQVLPPAGWRGVPNFADIFGERDTGEAEYRGKSYRCARYTSRWLESLYFVVYKTYAPQSIGEVADGADKIYYQSPFEGLKDTYTGEFTGSHRGMKKLQVDEAGNRIATYAFMENKKGFGLACYWRVSMDEGFVRFKGQKARPPSDEEWAAAVKVFDQVAKTLVIMDQVALSGTRIAAKSWGFSDDGWCVKCSDWNVLTSKSGQYTIEYATRKDFAARLATELDAIFALYKRTIYTGKGIPKCRVKLFDTEDDFQYYGQAWGAAAYWSPMQEEIVAYRFQGSKVKLKESGEDMTIAEDRNPEEVTFNIIYHEAFHQYMYFLMGRDRGVYVPSWLNEGMGDYFFGGRWNKAKTGLEIGVNDWRLETIVKAVKDNKFVSLEQIFRFQQSDYYSRAGLCYAEGWSINYFFMSPEGKKHGYDQIPMKMFNELKQAGSGEGWKKATDKAFAGYDLKKMEEQWKVFVLGLEKYLPKQPEPAK